MAKQTPSELDTLKAQMTEAMQSGDMEKCLALADKIKPLEKGQAKAKWEAKSAARDALTASVQEQLTAVAEASKDKIIELVGFDNARISFSLDWANEKRSCGITSKAPKAPAGGESGRTYERADSRDTEKDLLPIYADTPANGLPTKMQTECDGLTFAEAFAKSTDKNWRYNIRKRLLALTA